MSWSSRLASLPRWTFAAIAPVTMACSASPEDVGSASASVGPPPKDPNLLLPGPALPAHNQFTVEEPGAPQLGPCHAGGSPQALALCYTLTSKLDNPELRTIIRMPQVAFSGEFGVAFRYPMELDVQQGTSVTTSPGDLRFFLSGVLSSPVDFENVPLFDHASAVASGLFVYPEATASYVAPGNADLFTRGVRVGYTPLTVATQAVNADGSLSHPISSVEVALDPTVVLTPVQVYAAQSCSFRNYPGLGRADGALAVWDQVPVFSETDTYDATGQFLLGRSRTEWTTFGPTTAQTWETQTVQEYQSGGAAGSGYFTPDSVWRDCGVQFRLVRIGTFESDDSFNQYVGTGVDAHPHPPCPGYQGPPPSQDPTGFCSDLMLQLIADLQAQGKVLDRIPTVIVIHGPLPGSGTSQGGEKGITIPGTSGTDQPVSCVEAAAPIPAVLAHEVGHWAIQDDCSPQGGTCELMFSYNPLPPPTADECSTMRAWATATQKNKNPDRNAGDWRQTWIQPTCKGFACVNGLGHLGHPLP
jgi:hypothetical protein